MAAGVNPGKRLIYLGWGVRYLVYRLPSRGSGWARRGGRIAAQRQNFTSC